MSAVCVMSGAAAVVAPLGDVFKAQGRQRTLVTFAVLQFPLYIGLMVWAAPYGIVTVAWVRAGAQMLGAIPMMAMVMRAAKVRLREVLVALRPALAGTFGVVAGAGAVRLAWPSLSIGPLIVGRSRVSPGGRRVAHPRAGHAERVWRSCRLRPGLGRRRRVSAAGTGTRPLRVLHVIDSLCRGGAESLLAAMLRELAHHHPQVQSVVRAARVEEADPQLVSAVTRDTGRLAFLRSEHLYDPRFAAGLARAIRRHEIDVVHRIWRWRASTRAWRHVRSAGRTSRRFTRCPARR